MIGKMKLSADVIVVGSGPGGAYRRHGIRTLVFADLSGIMHEAHAGSRLSKALSDLQGLS